VPDSPVSPAHAERESGSYAIAVTDEAIQAGLEEVATD
jgi:hypothetical protein